MYPRLTIVTILLNTDLYLYENIISFNIIPRCNDFISLVRNNKIDKIIIEKSNITTSPIYFIKLY